MLVAADFAGAVTFGTAGSFCMFMLPSQLQCFDEVVQLDVNVATTFTSATSQVLISVEITLRITHAVHLTRLTDFFLDTGLFENDALGVLDFSFLFDVVFGLRLRRHFKRAASGLAVQTCRLRVAPHPRHRGLERSKEFCFRLPVIKE